MRKLILLTVITILIAFTLTGAAQAEKITELHKKVARMEKMVKQPISKWQMSPNITRDEALSPKTPKSRFRRVGIGYFWADVESIWLRTLYTVPETVLNIPVEGSKIGLYMNVEDYGEVYVNGHLKQIFRRSTGHITITDDAKPGERYFIVIKIRRKSNDTGLIRELSLEYSFLQDLEVRAIGFMEALKGLNSLLALDGQTTDDWVDVLNKAGEKIDLDALKNGKIDDFYASLDESGKVLAPLTRQLKKYSMQLIAYSHIDPAWMWDKAEGEHIVWKGTSEKVLELQEDFSDFVYVANQLHCYRWMEKDYPELFERIKAAVAKGVWEPMGAEWVEPDGNLPSGESYVRQFLYGRKYSKEKFDYVSTVGLTPDSFGYNWNMPQILTKSDMRGFITQKISWNDTTKFPHHVFWWESPDGSRMLTYLPEGTYGETVDAVRMAAQVQDMKERHGLNSNLVIFGIGDHGGGIPRNYTKRAYGLKASPIYANINFVSGEQLYDSLEEEIKQPGANIPVWDSELYLQYHRGTYTTQSKTKNNNRRGEIELMNAERFSSIAEIETRSEYPFNKIEEAWKMHLFNQFHDVLPGSSIPAVYKDADADYAWLRAEARQARDDSIKSIAQQAFTLGDGEPLVLFNGLSWTRDGLVELDLAPGISEVTIMNDANEVTPVQIIDKPGGGKSAVFVARSMPALGYSVYYMIPGRHSDAYSRMLAADGNTIENEFYRVDVDPKTGWVSAIYDKKNKRDIIEKGKTAFELQAYRELPSSDSWDPRFPEKKEIIPMPAPESVRIVENGPVRVTIEVARDFGEASGFKQYYSLLEGVPVIYGRLDAGWHESNVFLKSAFNLNLDADDVTYEIPYATIKRTAKPKTPAEKAQWEVSGHRFADYTDNSGDYGVTLLSYSKYGYDALDNVLRMTMLRCPNAPDPGADRGDHSIPYALYPHTGSWQDADTQLKAREYNDPIQVVKAEPHAGTLGKRHSFFSALPSSIVISTIKKSEDGKGYIIRLVETVGEDTDVKVRMPDIPKKIYETNLVERVIKEFDTPVEEYIIVPIGHYEIKTLKVVF